VDAPRDGRRNIWLTALELTYTYWIRQEYLHVELTHVMSTFDEYICSNAGNHGVTVWY
jgi:hypothetical protein